MCIRDRFYIKVSSTQKALRDLAKYYKKKFSIPVVALTGSVGKTTTKDMVAAVLGAVSYTHLDVYKRQDHAGEDREGLPDPEGDKFLLPVWYHTLTFLSQPR